MRISIILTIFLLSNFSLKGQEPNIFPPNPETSSILKFVEVPVNLNSGMSNINIPIHTIKTKSIDIPITLNYHSRGVKVGEISSRVGIGWALNVAGVVSRQKRGAQADDHPRGLLNGQFGTFYETIFEDLNTRAQIAGNFSTNLDDAEKQDVVPDMFYFNVNNISGKFIIDQLDKKPVQQRFSNINIEVIWENRLIVGFIIKDDDGNIYYFGKNNNSNNDSETQTLLSKKVYVNRVQDINSNPYIFKDSWFLNKIETKLGEKVEFKYKKETYTYWDREYDAKDNGETVDYSFISYKRNYVNVLDKIIYNSDTIIFKPSNDFREDLMGSRSLNQIIIKNKNQIIKKANLYYSYQSASTPLKNMNPFFLNLVNNPGHKRIFLDSLVFNSSDINSNEKQKYSFQYSNVKLPSRFSNEMDLWGYYNGKNNGKFMLKDGVNFYDRTVDTVKSEAGLLKSIKLPTGGKKVFHYNHNKGRLNFPMGRISIDGINIDEEIIQINHSLSPFDADSLFQNNIYKKQFLIENDIQATFSAWVTPSTGCSTIGGHGNECAFRIGLRNVSSNSGTNYMTTGVHSLDLNTGLYEISVRPLNPDYHPLSMEESFLVRVSYDSIDSNTSNSTNIVYGPGKRIHKIIIASSDGTPELSTEFRYGFDEKPESGVIYGLPEYVLFYPPVMGDSIGIPSTGEDTSSWFNQYFMTLNKPGSLFSNLQGNEIGYKEVVEYKIGVNEKLKTKYQFTNISDGGLFYEYPFHEPIDNQWLRGHLLSKEFYKWNGTKYLKSSSLYNTYSYANTNNIGVFNAPEVFLGDWGAMMPLPEMAAYHKSDSLFRFPIFLMARFPYRSRAFQHVDTPYNLNTTQMQVYHFTGGTMDLVESKTIDYHDNGMQIETTTKSKFDYSINYNPIEVVKYSSLGDSLSTRFYYPQDLLSSGIQTTAMQRLINENRIGTPVKTESYFNTEKISSDITKFTEFTTGTSNLLLPSETYSTKGSTNIDNFESENRDIAFNRYDEKGNILEYTLENGIPVSIIWGYNGKYPVAKIEGLSYNDIPQDLRNSISNASNLDNSSCVGYSGCNEATLRNHQKSLRAYLGDAMITTYTYDPLVGVTSITPPNGQTAYYEYDGFGRLKSVKDEAGNIVQDIQYHYRSQE